MTEDLFEGLDEDEEEDVSIDDMDFLKSSEDPKEVETKATDDIPLSSPMMQIWGIDNTVAEEVMKASALYSMKHGLFAGVPLLCRDSDCKYKAVCIIDPNSRKLGQRCPMEAGAILSRFDSYCKAFHVGADDEVLPEEEVDLSLIREIVDIEIQILRADNKIAINGDFIGETLHTVDKQGNPWYENVVTPEVEFKYELMEKRHKILQLLNSTRKDNKEVSGSDPSIKASIVMKKVDFIRQQDDQESKELMDVIDVELDDDNLVNDDGSINYDILDEIADKI